MKILVANDTRIENHHGCSRVMNCIDKNLKLRNIFDINYIPLLFEWSNYENVKKNIISSDLIIINGEGTLHHNEKHVTRLLDIIDFAYAYNIPTVVINATIFELSKNNIMKLSYSKCIYVRDKASQLYLKLHNINAEYCPDLTFWDTKETFETRERNKIGITEGFSFSPNRNILKLKNFEQFSVFNYSQALSSYKFLRRYISKTKLYKSMFKNNIISIENHIKFLAFLNQFKFVITGRYHVVCFCLYLNIPFKYVESNTPKISFLLDDIGLDKSKFKFYDDYQTIQFTLKEKELVNKFKMNSTKCIDNMFEKILKL